VHEPPVVRLPAHVYVEAEQLPDACAAGAVANVDVILNDALDGERGVFVNRESVDEYGWRNFGEIHADHEEQYYDDPRPLVSHYNNQFDLVLGFLANYVRTGDRRLFELGDDLARHVADIDIYWTKEDRAVYNGGLFWFTDHYLHAGTSTHRSYTRLNQVPGQDYGGGPGAEHNFTTGLLLHHRLTGWQRSREAVISLADWAIAMDRSWLGATGTATMTASPDYQGPGRGAGNSLNAALDGWQLTGESHYLDFADTIVRRVVHPGDDVDRLDLLNAEKRWSYTVFLMALIKYLRLRGTGAAWDERYAYAQACLQRYVRWMLDHERPYLDAREHLEFPTEAWPAQELRKANVLLSAVPHLGGEEGQAAAAKGAALAERAWRDLLVFPTRAQARALAIVMTEGLVSASRVHPAGSAPRPARAYEFGRPRDFRPLPVLLKGLARRALGRS
jgi:hypothetical protein